MQGCSCTSIEKQVSRKVLWEFFSLYGTMSGNLNSYLSTNMYHTSHYSNKDVQTFVLLWDGHLQYRNSNKKLGGNNIKTVVVSAQTTKYIQKLHLQKAHALFLRISELFLLFSLSFTTLIAYLDTTTSQHISFQTSFTLAKSGGGFFPLQRLDRAHTAFRVIVRRFCFESNLKQTNKKNPSFAF